MNKKIILCCLVFAFLSLAAFAPKAGAVATSSTAADTPISASIIASLQKQINDLQAQIQQLIILINNRQAAQVLQASQTTPAPFVANPAPACAFENEVFTDAGRICCAGLVRVVVGTYGVAGMEAISLPATTIRYTCKTPAAAATTTACAAENEVFTDAGRACCANLARVSVTTLGVIGNGSGTTALPATVVKYTCKPIVASITGACAVENEVFTDAGRACCAGLTRVAVGTLGVIGAGSSNTTTSLPATVIEYACKRTGN
jgi:hypothetical protein